jgi:hypothetical protein
MRILELIRRSAEPSTRNETNKGTQMITNLKDLFRLPHPLNVAVKELHMAQLELLQAHGALEAAKGHVAVLGERVKRLQATVDAYSKSAESA